MPTDCADSHEWPPRPRPAVCCSARNTRLPARRRRRLAWRSRWSSRCGSSDECARRRSSRSTAGREFREAEDRERRPVDIRSPGCPVICTPRSRRCCTARHTSERVVPSSSAMRVPLMTTVALSLSRRTMRPRRASVELSSMRDWSDAGDRKIMREGAENG